MNKTLTLDIVSDVSCPWCIIGYKALEQALTNLSSEIDATITWQPFELNPQMPPEGQEITEHITQKYGISVEQAAENREAIVQRGLSVGYEFAERRGGGMIYNTFNAHRLLHWAVELGRDKQMALKLALFDLYFKENGNPSDFEQLLIVVDKVGLDVAEAKAILHSDKFMAEVRKQQQHYQAAGISSVPAVIVNNKHLISGGQPVEIFEKALKQIADEE
ncbi:DsbA family oxidoreductase [uncultured Paraglaciecola sp.]|uniref:DsbA family oxidoreductase n=1 Tax=uncultured Paraglaciecola sp. TaxID=1765024 RepID=UPI002598E2A7|nr:DsbA family oxidoreductase [uncultured Paraglaciecola sp.]